MGEVWVADQLEPLKRSVAMKLIKPGMDSRGVRARFEAERQALAVMDHPNIARVLDGSTTPDGRPYFVMELVKGTPITDFCDARRLTPRERLELFVPVCQAIQHAHMKGIIHRDVKPSNVLVALHDEVPGPKVIDFGVAKAVGQQLTEKTIHTGFGALVGTPAYMAPEQATFNQFDVDTRADVYALGVLLYELLAGSPPVEPERLKKAALDEVLRIVRDEEPPRPSQRLSTSQARATIAATRQTDAVKLSALMRGEFDWIVMKALEKDRARRYDTATALAKDVQRYLTGELVEARPPTLGYRLRKFVTRHKARVATAAVVTWALLMGTSLSVIGFLNADSERTRTAIALRQEEAQRKDADALRVQTAEQRDAAVRLGDELRQAAYATNINLAAASLELGHVGHVRELLDRTRPAAGEPARGFEWHYLRREMQQETASFAAGGSTQVKLSPNGRHLAVTFNLWTRGDKRAQIRVFEVGTGREKWTREIDGADAGAIAFRPDGSLVGASRYTPESGAGVRKTRSEFGVWEVESGDLRGRGKEEGRYWTSLAFSPDGTTVAGLLRSSGEGRETVVKTYATAGLTVRTEAAIPGGPGAYGDLAYTRSGRLRVAYDVNDTVRVREDLGGPDLLVFDSREEGFAQDVSLSEDGTNLAVVTADRQVRVWYLAADPPTLRGRFRVEHHDSSSAVCLGPDGRSLAVATSSTTGRSLATVWDVRTGKLVRTLRGHTAAVERITIGSDGRTLATTSDDRTAKLWDVPPWAEPDQTYHANAGFARTGLAVRPDGTFASLAYHIISEQATDERWRTFELRAEPGGVSIFTTPRVPRVSGNMRSAVAAPDGSRLAAVDWDAPDRVQVWDTGTGKALATLPADGVPGIKAWFGPADRLLVLEPDTAYRLYDLSTGRPLARFAGGHNRHDRCAFSPDGRLLVTQSSGRAGDPVVVRDATTGAVLHDLKDHKGPVSMIVFSRDSSRLATDGMGGVVTLWDAATGRQVHRLTGHAGWVQAADFSPDGRRLFTGGADSTVRVWDTATGQDLESIRESAGVGSRGI